MTIYALGEVMLRYTPPDYSLLKNAHTFDVQVGGAELNTLISLSSFDHNTEMITVLPKNELAKFHYRKWHRQRSARAILNIVKGA